MPKRDGRPSTTSVTTIFDRELCNELDSLANKRAYFLNMNDINDSFIGMSGCYHCCKHKREC
jgi:hypothetical protein